MKTFMKILAAPILALCVILAMAAASSGFTNLTDLRVIANPADSGQSGRLQVEGVATFEGAAAFEGVATFAGGHQEYAGRGLYDHDLGQRADGVRNGQGALSVRGDRHERSGGQALAA